MRTTTDHNTFLGNHLPGIRAVYTRTDLILDAITVILIITSWGLALWLHSISPDIIPTKLSLSGEVVSWGGKNNIYIMGRAITLIGAISLGMTFLSSRYFKYPVPVNVRNHFVIHQLTVYMSKCICILIILSIGCAELLRLHSILGFSQKVLTVLFYLICISIIVVIAGFILVMRNRRTVVA